jgi:hypothetical protein
MEQYSAAVRRAWQKRVGKWLTQGSNCTADELLAISEFYAPVRHIEFSCYESLQQDAHRMHVEDMKKLVDWWHTDEHKRTILNKMLSIYSQWEGWDKKQGPEHKIARNWTRLNAEQRAYIKTKVEPIHAWEAIHKTGETDETECPLKVMTWQFIEEYSALVAKHKIVHE